MTKTEELQYLYGIVSEAREWTITDPRHNAVELEVDLRIKNLLNELGGAPAKCVVPGSGSRRVRPSELTLVPGLSLAQYKYRARAQLAGLSDSEIEQKYAFYRECYDVPTPAPEPDEKTLKDIVDNVVERAAQEQQLSASEKMKQEEQCWAEHFRAQHSGS